MTPEYGIALDDWAIEYSDDSDEPYFEGRSMEIFKGDIYKIGMLFYGRTDADPQPPPYSWVENTTDFKKHQRQGYYDDLEITCLHEGLAPKRLFKPCRPPTH